MRILAGENNLNEDIFWIWTTLFNNTDAKFLSDVLIKTGGIDSLWKLTGDEFKRMMKCSDDIAYMFTDITRKDRAAEIYEICINKGIKLIFHKDADYPKLLRHIDKPPRILYKLGSGSINDRAVSIVGSRHSTYNGETVAYDMARDLVKNGYSIVSGMAKGIDYFAHSGALKARGKTIAVLGSGVDVIYPYANRVLYEEICESGAVISEYPPGTKPTRYNFPLRNRIISGLSLGTVVVEAGEKSGSLITAGYAGTYGRNVYAVPGDINRPSSKGTNALIRDGAILVRDAGDIIEDLGGFIVNETIEKKSEQKELTVLQKEIYDFLCYKPMNVEELLIKMNSSPDKLIMELSIMEMQNIVFKRLDQKYIVVN